MFFFTGYTLKTVIGFVFLLVMLIGLNELTRRSKWISIIFYVALPIVFSIFVWPITTVNGSSGATWFAWVKTYSALAGVIGFMLLRYVKKLETNKFMLTFPMLILVINILEAVYADIECYSMHGVVRGGLLMEGGPWNIINAIAGIFLCLSLSGWLKIKISNTKSRDMIWADQLWFWIIAYDLWNISYCYNCISNRSFYAGFTLIVSCTVAEFLFRKGAWLQHRAQTLAIFAMFSLTANYASYTDWFGITSTQAAAPKTVFAVAALIVNLAVFAYELYIISKTKRNPLKEEVFTDLKSYKAILAENKLN